MNKLVRNRYLYFHVIYWIFYILFFTMQRSAFYGFTGFTAQLKINLAYLPGVLAATYFITEFALPAYFYKRKVVWLLVIILVLCFISPAISYLVRIQIVEPYIFYDHTRYTLYNFLTAIMIDVFGIVPLAGLKISQLIRSDWIHHEKVEHDKLEAELKLRETELKLLKGQIHPHFLFNTMNNLYSLALERSEKTPEVIIKMADMLSYIIYDCNAERVSLEKEVEFIKSFIDLEKLRYDESCQISLTVHGDMSGKHIAPMILHTFVDNGFKHGSCKNPGDAWIRMNLSVNGHLLMFAMINTIGNLEPVKNEGIGIANARRRLQLIYPDKHDLVIHSDEKKFSVFLKIQL